MIKSKIILEHESVVRKMVSDSKGLPYKSLEDLEQAKGFEDAYVVMEGDWGGQIYLVVPVSQVKCSIEQLQRLLLEVDKTQWDEVEGTGLYFERMKVGSGVSGGMGGGRAGDELWVHERLENLKNKIQDVISNKAQSII